MPRAGGWPALLRSRCPGQPRALNPSSRRLSGWLPRQGEEPKAEPSLAQPPRKQRHATWKQHDPYLGPS